jgi:hypothetical protein
VFSNLDSLIAPIDGLGKESLQTAMISVAGCSAIYMIR